MANFVDCWNSLKSKGYKHADGSEVLNDQDRASIEKRIQEHLKTGLDPLEAAKASVKSHLDEAHGQLQSIYDQVGEHVANIEGAKLTEEPRGFPESQEPFPSITRSAEQQRRVGTEVPKVREALSLDELRLMRERKELELQNEIAKRAGGGTHPAVDQRISQIESELTDIANRELQQRGGGQATKTEGGIGEEVQKGQGQREAVLATERVQPPAATSTEPHVSAVANRFVEERVKAGELSPIAPGQGYSAQEMVQRGLKMSPEEINQHVSDLMQGKGDPIKQAQAVRANEAQLSQRSNQLSKEAEADPTNMDKKLAADNAFKDLTDWHNGPLARIKTIFHGTGEGLQGEIPVDLSTFNGMREAWLKDTGKPPPPEVEPILRDTAKKVATANGEVDTAVSKVGQSIDQSARGRKLPSYEQVRENILQRLKERAPCN